MISIRRLPDEVGEKRWRVSIYPIAIVAAILFAVIVWQKL